MKQIFDEDLWQKRKGRNSSALTSNPILDHICEALEEKLYDSDKKFNKFYCNNEYILGKLGKSAKFSSEDGSNTIAQIKSDEFFKSEDERVYRLVRDPRPDLQKNEVSFKSGNWYNVHLNVFELQYTNDIPSFMYQQKTTMQPNDICFFVFFGGNSLHQLRKAVIKTEEDLSLSYTPIVSPMIDVKDGGMIMYKSGFHLPVSEIETIEVEYKSLKDLATDLRSLNLTNILVNRDKSYRGKLFFQKLEENLLHYFPGSDNRFIITFDIIYLFGIN